MAMQLLKGRLFKQVAVYWPKTGSDEFGQPTYEEPVEVRCRWEEKAEQYTDRGGRELVSKALVYTMIDIVEGSALMLGRLNDVEDEANPFGENNPNQAWEVKRVDKTPTLDAKQFLRVAYL